MDINTIKLRSVGMDVGRAHFLQKQIMVRTFRRAGPEIDHHRPSRGFGFFALLIEKGQHVFAGGIAVPQTRPEVDYPRSGPAGMTAAMREPVLQ